MDFSRLVWVVINMDDRNRMAYVGDSKVVAMRVAEALVGNRAAGHTGSDIILYGPGDGTTSVMVRQYPADAAERESRINAASLDLFTVASLILSDLHSDGEGQWCAGPWADPSHPDGEGGKVDMLRKAVRFAETGEQD